MAGILENFFPVVSQRNFKSWQQHSRVLPAERMANTYICSLLIDEHGIGTNWHQAELHTFIFTCDSSWLETFQWDRFLLENGNLLNTQYFTWNMERFDELLANKAWFPYPTEWHSTPRSLAWLRSSSCASDPRLAAPAWESKSPEGSSSNQSSALH